MKVSLKLIVFLMFVSIIATGCPPKPKGQSGGFGDGGTAADSSRPSNSDIISDSNDKSNALGLKDIYFAYNSSSLSSDARRAIKSNVSILEGDRNLRITVAGHCDDRGSSEYNLSLGEDRAKAVRKYLIDLGINSRSISFTSYGEEQPQCSASTSSCWQKNRRAQFLVR